ncbi:MAG: OmpL47-type beta-barrel domain-containing protein [Solirubrobacterales bacterium]
MIARRRNSDRLAWFAIALAVLCAISLVHAARSSATSYAFKSCDASTEDRSSFGLEWEGSGLGYFIPPKIECPTGIKLDMGTPVVQETKSVAWFHPYSDSVIKSVKFKYYGGDTVPDGYSYTVRSCAWLCDEVAQLVPGGSVSSPKVALLSMPPVGPLESNQGEASVALQIECMQAICPDPPEMVVKNFEFEYDDSVAPLVTNIVTDPENAIGPGVAVTFPWETGETGETGPPDETPVAWVRGNNFRLTFEARDEGSGVTNSYLGVDDDEPEPLYGVRYFEPQGARISDLWVPYDTNVDLRELADGDHQLWISTLDWAMSAPSAKKYPFRVDNTAPGEPAGLDFSDNVTRWDWTPTPGVVVSHADATLDELNTEYSGFKSAVFDVRASPSGTAAVEDEVFDPAAPSELLIPHEGLWDLGVKYRDNAGNPGNRAHAPVGFDSTTPEPADPVPLDWISLDELHAGVDQTWTAPPPNPELESGICAYAFSVDDELLSIPEPNPDVLAPTTSARIPSGIGEGNHYAHVRSIACNGLASAQEPSPVNVDGTAPSPTLHGVSSSGEWSTSEPSASLSATDTLSGVAALEYGFDGEASMNLVPGSSTPITIPQGARTISYRGIDAVGNASPWVELDFKADWTPPAAQFAPRDPIHPNALTAEVDDPHSGLAGAGMQIRRSDSGASAIESNWRSLGEFETLADQGAKSRSITRTIPDGRLADGSYEVRVTARDVAGNWSESEPVLQLTLPVRAKPTLSAAIATVGKRSKVNWSGASQDRVLRFGKKAALVGSLLDGARNPIANARVVITTTEQFGTPGTPKAVTTDARGEFVVPLANRGTRRFDLRFDGNERAQPIDQTADIRVRAALDFKISKHSVRSGQPFTLSGRLLSGDMGLPEGGKIVTIRFLRKRVWFPTYATPPVNSRGRFKYKAYDGITAKRKTKVYFQVTAFRDGSWPFLTGSSKIIALTIKP